MLDLHVHVLPGIDDGPRTLEDALALARALAEDGIEHIVATPHIYPGVFDNTANRIGEVFDGFQAAVSEAGIALTMTWAAEVRICPEILEWIELRRLPMLNGSLVGPSTALIELPDGQIPVGTDKLMGLMLDRGVTPLVAHPERNKAVMEQHTRLDALRRMGCKFQLTAGSLLGDFGTRAQTTAQKLLEAGWVDVIATDSHNRSSRRPRMKAAREWLAQQYDEALALRLTKTQPTEIAGVSSFAVQSGEQRLVFRDMPAMAPLEDTNQWSVDLMLGPDLSAPRAGLDLDSPQVQQAASSEHWSLIDFRIDAVLDDLQSVSLRTDAPVESELFDKAHAAAPNAQQDSDEDWLLPKFLASPPVVAPSAPPRRAPVAPADLPAPVPVSPPVTTAPIRVATPTPVPTPMPAPERVRAVEAVTVAPRQRVEPVWESVPTATPVPVSAPSVTSAPIPVVTDIVPVKPKETATAIPEPVTPMPEPAPAVAAAMVSHPTPAPSQPPRGMRLSEVAPRDWPAGGHTEVIHRPSNTASRPSSMAKAGHQANSSVTLSTQIAQSSRKVLTERPQQATADGTRNGFRLSDLNPLPNRRR